MNRSETDQQTHEAKPKIGLWSASAIVVASMIGAGVFTTSGFALADLGTPLRVVAAWCIAGAIAMCGAAAYGALAQRFTASGGEYLFLTHTVHPAAGFVAGAISMVAGFTVAIAYAARVFETYLAAGLPPGLVAVAVIVLASAAHLVGLRAGSWSQNAVIAVKIAVLVGFLVVALPPVATRPIPIPTDEPPPLTVALMASSLVWISLSYAGFNGAVYLMSEVRDAKRTVPRSLLIGTGVVTLLYIALNVVFVCAGPVAELSGQADVARRATERLAADGLLPPIAGRGVQLVILLSMLTSVSVSMQTGPRVYAKMAADGVLPRWVAFEGAVPRRAIVLQMLAAVAVAFFSTVYEMLDYLSLTLSISSAIAVAGLFGCRGEPRIAWWRRVAAAIYVLATLSLAGLVAWNDPGRISAAAATILGGLLLYAAMRRFGR